MYVLSLNVGNILPSFTVPPPRTEIPLTYSAASHPRTRGGLPEESLIIKFAKHDLEQQIIQPSLYPILSFAIKDFSCNLVLYGSISSAAQNACFTYSPEFGNGNRIS
ncbi:hypothetical protein AVEN_193158-1 [Araneus ventricosus]|uniref:Uncharacterized protein n=1 Tax=Araneus ventricosus TaxID=182803 RepID=A0A4Y2B349_ARAVE|nr:hypothetical protein AVEN_193158-1 [Araneus ventricosus]